MRSKRKFSTFSLAFLDIMSCGFGAVVLVFLIIKHEVNTQVEVQQVDLQAEVNLLEEEITEGQLHLVSIKNALATVSQNLVETDGLARKVNDEIDAVNNKIVQLESLNCRPCHRYGKSKCPKDHFKCMKDLDVSLFSK